MVIMLHCPNSSLVWEMRASSRLQPLGEPEQQDREDVGE
jgi:hypothetical protein